ncbi:MAG: endolytic transglycosylase MltG [Bacteroidota bacterium]
MKGTLKFILLGVIAILALVAFSYYQRVFSSNVVVEDGDEVAFYIPTGSDYVAVGEKLLAEKRIKNAQAFHWVAEKMNYPNHVYPGRYLLNDGMSTRELVTLLRSGKQAPMRFTFNKFRTLEDFAVHTAENLEMTKTSLMQTLEDEEYLKTMGLTKEKILGILVPNTYELYWNVSPQAFVDRMYKEYRAFWDKNDRNKRRTKWGLTRMEVMTLASIVEEETNKTDEKATVAGVYLNRIRQGMPLQADPTVRFALQDFTIKRVLNSHLEIDSPYNTYKIRGLPPGPICTASIPSIDAVLNGERHEYVYFCVRTDGSGYHHFSKTLTEHLNYARQYHSMLDAKGIKK